MKFLTASVPFLSLLAACGGESSAPDATPTFDAAIDGPALNCSAEADYGTVGAMTGNAFALGYYSVSHPLSGSVTLMVEMFDNTDTFPSGFVAGTYTLGGSDLAYETCGLCVSLLLLGDIRYMATGGTVQIDEIPVAGDGGMVTFSATDVTFSPEGGEEDACTSAATGFSFSEFLAAGVR